MVTVMSDRHQPQKYKDSNHHSRQHSQEDKHPSEEHVVQRVSVIQRIKCAKIRTKQSDLPPDATHIDVPKATTDDHLAPTGDLFPINLSETVSFNLEFLDSNFVSSLIESVETENEYYDPPKICLNSANHVNFPEPDIKSDILDQAFGHIRFTIDSTADYFESNKDLQITNLNVSDPAVSLNSNNVSEMVNTIVSTNVIKEDDKTIKESQNNQSFPIRSGKRAKGSTGPYNKRGRKLGYRSENTKDESAVCGVCGAKAGRHSYYGGTCCQSCRAFFRRCVQSQSYHSLACWRLEEVCNVTISNRKKCMACRFNKCLQAGMKATYVLSDMKKMTPTNRSDTSIESVSEALEEMWTLCQDLVESTFHSSSPSVLHLTQHIHQHTHLPSSVLHLTQQRHQQAHLPPYLYSQFHLLVQHTSCLLLAASSVPTLSSSLLCTSDQTGCLMTANTPLVTAYLSVMLVSGSSSRTMDCIPSYCQLYPPGWCLVTTMEERHGQLWRKISDTTWDSGEMVLVLMLLIFSPDSECLTLQLSDCVRRRVEEVQAEWARHAQVYCSQVYGQAGGWRSRLGEIIMVIAWVREVVEIGELRVVCEGDRSNLGRLLW